MPAAPAPMALASLAVALALVLALGVVASLRTPSSRGLGVPAALALGVVEGITEFLPVSSTGHLAVAERILGVLDGSGSQEAATAYAICLQAGAMAAVAVLYRRRLAGVVAGLFGRDAAGARLAKLLVLAAAPTGAAGLVLGSTIKDHLFGIGPVVAAWAVGGAVLLLLAPRLRGGTTTLERLPAAAALFIGFVQMAALWPGVSRSLVTILAALAVGLRVQAAVEFSFLVGLLTLGAATGYETVRQGGTIVERFGVTSPLIGLLAAFVSAVVAIRWLTGVVERHQLGLFGWYRISIAGVVTALVLSGIV